jgi:hypothetical protein
MTQADHFSRSCPFREDLEEETMARRLPTRFLDRLHEVQLVLDVAQTGTGRHFDFGREVLPGVHAVRLEVHGQPIAFSLWDLAVDIVEICGDAAYPATGALLAIDADQARELRRRGVFVDLAQFTRSDSVPGIYYALLDLNTRKQLHHMLHKLVPQLEPHDDRMLVS